VLLAGNAASDAVVLLDSGLMYDPLEMLIKDQHGAMGKCSTEYGA
jgi:hypothetical protein